MAIKKKVSPVKARLPLLYSLGVLMCLLQTPLALANDKGLSQYELSLLIQDPELAESILVNSTPTWRQQPVQQYNNLRGFNQDYNINYQTAPFVHKTRWKSSTSRSSNLQRLPNEIKRLLRRSGLKESRFSAVIMPVNGKKAILSHKGNILRTPASIMKLITTYSAVGILGPNFRWKTNVYIRGKVRKGTLNGDLIIKGYGDPDFTTRDLRSILRNLRVRHGIRHLKGRLILDNSYFRVLNKNSGRFDGKRYAAYNAIPDALMFNDRMSHFTVRNVRGRPIVTTSTPAANVKIINKIRSVRGRCRGRSRSPTIRIKHSRYRKTVTFSGRYSKRCGVRRFSRVMTDPASMIYSSVKRLWRTEVGGRFKAKFVRARKPRHARLIHTHKSKPLYEIIREVNKDSNNLMARQLLLTIGAYRSGKAGNEHNGAKAIKVWLRSQGLNFPGLRIENGSGLSRTAKFTAQSVANLLQHAYHSPYRNLFMNSLAIAGIDGTMKRRLKRTSVKGRGFFKTGTLRNVRSIAGYVKGKDGRMYIVVIMHNDPKARTRGLKTHDELIKWAFKKGQSQQFAMR